MFRTTIRQRLPLVSLLGLAAAVACEPTGPDAAPGASPASGMLAVAGETLVVAAPDHDQVLVIDAASREVRHRVDVSDEPSHVIVDGGRALVTTRYGNTLDVVDIERGELLRSITVGVEPVGLTRVDADRVAIALAGEAAVVVVNTRSGEIEQRVALDARDPRGIARVEDGRLFVTHMTAGTMSVVDLDSGRATLHSMATENTVGGVQTHPNLMRSLTVAPDGATVLVAHTQSDSATVRAPIDDGFEDPSMGGGCGYSGCPSQLPAQTAAITEVDVGSATVLTPSLASMEEGQGGGGFPGGGAEPMPDCFDCFGVPMATNPPSFLNPNEMRFGGVPLNNPTAIALFDGGRGMLVLHTGSRNVLMLRRDLDGTAGDVLGVVNVGHGAHSIAVSADGSRAFVFNQFDGTITELELPTLGKTEPRTTSKYIPADEGSNETAVAEFREVPVISGETWTVLEDALDPFVSRGRKLFHDALDTRISQTRSVSCATCHPDGRNDGQTWQFTFGPRNTPQLGGGILDTAPFHWPGDVTTHRDLNSLTVLAFMGGTGLDTESLDAIGAFIDTIRPAPSAVALAEMPSEAVMRGMEIFNSSEAGCTECHAGDHFTDNKNWDVRTQAADHDRRDFQTPVLHGLSRSGPYLHDGSKRTLADLVRDVIQTDRMGHGSHLTDQQAADLVEYLESL